MLPDSTFAKGDLDSAPHNRRRGWLNLDLIFRGSSAKGAARTSGRIRNRLAPHSVLREFLKT